MIDDEFNLQMKAGSCPGGDITFKKGNAGMLCNMHIKAGYHSIKEASIDLEVKEAKELVRILSSLINIYEPSDG